MKKLFVVLTGTALLFALGCNDQGIQGINPDDPHNGPDGHATPPPEADTDGDGIPDPVDGDTDGDGIPDEDDNIPCMAFWMEVWNQDVSSASVLLNATEIISSSWFPTAETWQDFVNPSYGLNVLELGGKLNGSPEDLIHFHISDTEGFVYIHETLIRASGPPVSGSYEFYVDVDCGQGAHGYEVLNTPLVY